MRAPAVRVGALALSGAALLAWPAHIFRIDWSGGNCALQPPLDARIGAAIVYAVAVALLGLAWRASLRTPLPLRTSFLLAALVHAVALAFPPFLSTDPVYYAVAGKALAAGGTGMPLDVAIPGHPWLQLLPPEWRSGSSPYFVGFDQLSRLIAIAAGDRIGVAMRAYQLVGAMCTFGTAAVLTRAFDAVSDREAAAALILFSPLTVIEATQGGHNDAILMLTVALFAWATVRSRPGVALASLAAGLLVKASALLLLGFEVGRRVLASARRLLGPRRVMIAGFTLVIASLAVFLALHDRVPAFRAVGALFGNPADRWEHCTHSVECLPRALLRYIFDLPRAAWVTGILFRAGGGLWILWAAAKAGGGAGSAATLRWTAIALFYYYLLFHGWMESWYLLSLLPLAAFASPLYASAIRFFTFAAVTYYPLDLLLTCSWNPIAVGAKELFEAIIVIGIPGLFLIRRATRRPA